MEKGDNKEIMHCPQCSFSSPQENVIEEHMYQTEHKGYICTGKYEMLTEFYGAHSTQLMCDSCGSLRIRVT